MRPRRYRSTDGVRGCLTFGKVIFSLARCCNKRRPSDSSNRKTEKARCSTPCDCFVEKTCESFFDADPITLSSSSRTNTVSFSIKSVCDRPAPQAAAPSVDFVFVMVNQCRSITFAFKRLVLWCEDEVGCCCQGLEFCNDGESIGVEAPKTAEYIKVRNSKFPFSDDGRARSRSFLAPSFRSTVDAMIVRLKRGRRDGTIAT